MRSEFIAENKQLTAEYLRVKELGRADAAENRQLKVEIERLRALLRANNHHLAKLVNGTDEDDPQTWEQAKDQVIATHAALEPKP